MHAKTVRLLMAASMLAEYARGIKDANTVPVGSDNWVPKTIPERAAYIKATYLADELRRMAWEEIP